MTVRGNMGRFVVFQLLLAVAAFSVTASGSENADHPKAVLKDGTEISGVFKEFHSDEIPAHGKTEAYYGIPYAQPPVGPLRFKPPVPYGKLNSPFNALELGSSCMQQMLPNVTGILLTNDQQSEDCLFLDVIVPHPKPEKAPVFFSIHGGGFVLGAGNMPYGTPLPSVVYGKIIVVTFNYRLTTLGFSSTGDDVIPGNIGLMDQQLALKWVNENIEAFGGDPSSITIGGVSAGSSSVGFQMLSPGSRGLFKNAIMQSGSPLDIWNGFRSPEASKTDVKSLARLLECTEEEIADDQKLLECLQAVPAEDIIKQTTKMIESDPSRFFAGPVVDGRFLPYSPSVIIERGEVNGENVIVGTNRDEGNLFLLQVFPDKEVKPVVNSTMFGPSVSLLGGGLLDQTMLDLIKTIYTPDVSLLLDDTRDDFFHEVSQFLGDRLFFCSESQFARLLSESISVYRYTMTYVPSYDFMDVKWAGAGHGDEVQFTAGAVFEDEKEYRDEERDMSRLAMNYWLNFIKYGDPNKADDANKRDLVLPVWPRFTKGNEVFKDLTPEMNNVYMEKRGCYFINNVFNPLKEALDELQKLREKDDAKSKWTEEGQCEGESCHQEHVIPNKSEP